MRTGRRQLLLLLGATAVAGCARRAGGQSALRAAAASDLEPAFTEIAAQFRARTGRSVVFTFASSGSLAQQLEHGAPYDLYASASADHVERLLGHGRLVTGSARPFARGRVALWTRPGVPPVTALADVSRPDLRRIAVANPEHAPYGRAAVAALHSSGLYEAVRPRLVYAENVRQALQFAETGNADLAMVALTLVYGQLGTYVVPESAHPPLVQTLAVVRGGDEAGAAALVAFITGPVGQAILQQHGFPSAN
jgi:molybdate transport system substrate-binding protein